MTTSKRREDRRTQRTRQVLQQAFRDVVREKGFTATSIREITERANVNRGTFYLHFADKHSLAEAVARDAFRQSLVRALPDATGWSRPSLRALIQAVLSCLECKYRHQPYPPSALAGMAPLVEQAMHEELTGLLLTWLKQGRRAEAHSSAPLERIARVVSWAIFGTALQWSQERTTTSSEEMGNTILLVITEGIARLAPELVPASPC